MNQEMRRIEVFSAGCVACEETIQLVRSLVCASCEIEVHDMHKPDVAAKAKSYGVKTVPFGNSTPGCQRAEPLSNRRCGNPKGMVSSSPRLRGTSYLGLAAQSFFNPNGVVSCGHGGPQPRWGCGSGRGFPG